MLFDAAVGHAKQGENMSYAVYAAAKLQRPEDACRLWDALQPCVHTMSSRDVFDVLWACARLGLGGKLDLAPALDRLEQLLAASQRGSTAGDTDSSMELDPFEAAAYDNQSESPEQAEQVWADADHGPEGIPGWLIAQIAWSLAEMKLQVKPVVAENLFKAVRCGLHFSCTSTTALLSICARVAMCTFQ